jgi:hypothetical protein
MAATTPERQRALFGSRARGLAASGCLAEHEPRPSGGARIVQTGTDRDGRLARDDHAPRRRRRSSLEVVAGARSGGPN